jgi:leader peptidase (prepilin peptidase)/N-methyltransferase
MSWFDFLDPKFYFMFYPIVFIYGICIGSFLNVVILRLPLNESLSKQSSHCFSCGAKIKFYDNVPLISWIVLRGKCRNCGAKISAQYPIVEGLNGIMYIVSFAVFGLTAKAVISCIMFSLLIVIGVMDWNTLEIDIRPLIGVAILAIPSAIFKVDSITIVQRILGGLCVSVPFFIIGEVSGAYIKKKTGEKVRGIELGDTLLMLCAGLVVGVKIIALAGFLGVIIAGVGGVVYKRVTGDSKFAFGPYLAVGIAISMLFGTQLIDWYVLNFLTFEQY